MSYVKTAERIKKELDAALGFTFSVGLDPNKVVAKIASKSAKPSGLTAIPGRELHHYLAKLPVEKVWHGPNTSAFLAKHGIRTALEYAQRQEPWVKKYLSKPFYQIWQELNGQYVFELALGEHETYYTIQKVKTFTPASSDRAFVLRSLRKMLRTPASRRASTNSQPSGW